MPTFSLILPTLRRADTFQYALRTLVNQAGSDLEIIVQNNGRDRQTEDIIASFADDRIKHFWSDEVLPMSRNWELALANARGDYVTFIGDDDGLLSDACRIAASIIDRTAVEIVSWRPFSYYWDSHIIAERKNLLLADVDLDAEIAMVDSRRQLLGFYDLKLHYSELPMVYNSFVSRAVIDRVIAKAGTYFLGVAPDVTSGIVNAACSQQFALLNRPLSVAGLSGHSTGHNVSLSPPGWISDQQVKTSLGEIVTDPRLVPTSHNLEMMLAGDALTVRDRLFPDDLQATINFRRLAQSVASAINDRPGFYDETLAAVGALADKHNFSIEEIAFPERIDRVATLPWGETSRGERRTLHVIDGQAAGITQIADAVTYVEKTLLPRLDHVDQVPVVRTDGPSVPLATSDESLVFSSAGNGVPALEYGWGIPEAWGTWSVRSYMLLRFRVPEIKTSSTRVECVMRAFLFESHDFLDFECRILGQSLFKQKLTSSSPEVFEWDVPAHLIAATGEIELEFIVKNPRSPAQLGASSDTRLLGVGLERMRVG